MPGRQLLQLTDKDAAYSIDMSSVVLTLCIHLTIFVVIVVGFSACHRYGYLSERIYSPRRFLGSVADDRNAERAPTPAEAPVESRHWFSWVKEVLNVREEEILSTIGLDAVLFLRFERFCVVFFSAVAVYAFCILLPIHLHGDDSKADGMFLHLTVAHVKEKSPALWAHVVGAYLLTAIGLALFTVQFQAYVRLRHKHKLQMRAKNYSLMVREIPQQPYMRTNADLWAFFDGIYPDSVQSVLVMLDADDLTVLVKKRQYTLEKLEYCLVRFSHCRDKKQRCLQRLGASMHPPRATGSPRASAAVSVDGRKQQQLPGLHPSANTSAANASSYHLVADTDPVTPAAASAGAGAGEAGVHDGAEQDTTNGGMRRMTNDAIPQSDENCNLPNILRDWSLSNAGLVGTHHDIRATDDEEETAAAAVLTAWTELREANVLVQQEQARLTGLHRRAEIARRRAQEEGRDTRPGEGDAYDPDHVIIADAVDRDSESSPFDYIDEAEDDIDPADGDFATLNGGGGGDAGADTRPLAARRRTRPTRRGNRRRGAGRIATATARWMFNATNTVRWLAGVQANPRSSERDSLASGANGDPSANSGRGTWHAGYEAPSSGGASDAPDDPEEAADGGSPSSRRFRPRWGRKQSRKQRAATQERLRQQHRKQELVEQQSETTVAQEGATIPAGVSEDDGDGERRSSTFVVDALRFGQGMLFGNPVGSVGFVTMNSLVATNALKAVGAYPVAGELLLSAAPSPDDIIWNNVNVPRKTQRLAEIIGTSSAAVITILFSVPVLWISAWTNSDTVKDNGGPFATWLSDNPVAAGVFALLSPLMLLLLLTTIPPLFGLIARASKEVYTISQTHSLVLQRYWALLFYQVFIVLLLSTTLLSSLNNVIDDPKAALSEIGASIPQVAGFYCNYISLRALSGNAFELIRGTSYATAALKRLVSDDLTFAQRNKMLVGTRSLHFPGGFFYGKVFADHLLVYTLAVTYSLIAPLIVLGALLFFAIGQVVYRRQLFFVYQPEFTSTGELWAFIFRQIVVGMVTSQVALICVLVTKLAFAQATFMLPLIILTLLASSRLWENYALVGEHVPASLSARRDMELQAMLDEDSSTSNASTAAGGGSGHAVTGTTTEDAGDELAASQETATTVATTTKLPVKLDPMTYLQPELRPGHVLPRVHLPEIAETWVARYLQREGVRLDALSPEQLASAVAIVSLRSQY